jgi:hypothetical protein
MLTANPLGRTNRHHAGDYAATSGEKKDVTAIILQLAEFTTAD